MVPSQLHLVVLIEEPADHYWMVIGSIIIIYLLFKSGYFVRPSLLLML